MSNLTSTKNSKTNSSENLFNLSKFYFLILR